MRVAFVLFAVLAAFIFAPRTELSPKGLDSSKVLTSVLSTSAVYLPGVQIQTIAPQISNLAAYGQGHKPTVSVVISMPILPDIPEPIAILTRDRPPRGNAFSAGSEKPLVSDVAARTPVASDPALSGRITGNALALRSGPGKSNPALGALNKGERVRITGETNGNWVPIEVASNGQRGWVFHKFVTRIQ